MRHLFSMAIGIILTAASSLCAADVTDTASFRIPHSSFVALRGNLELPAEGLWHVRAPSDESVVQLYLIPPREAGQRLLGRRMRAAIREDRINQGRWRIRWLQTPCQMFAQGHEGVGPASFDDLDLEDDDFLKDLQKNPWDDWNTIVDGDPPEGPFVFLVPQAKFHWANEQRRTVDENRREILALELRPYVDDGKHWVLYTDATTVREPIDKQRMEKYGLTIRPVTNVADEELRVNQPAFSYTVVAVCNGAVPESIDVGVYNSIDGDEQKVTWTPDPRPQDETVLESLHEARRFAWQPYLRAGWAPVLDTWLSSRETPETDWTEEPGDNLTAFSILGGRAAVEETLQLQNLRLSGWPKEATVDVASLPGVEVEAHPFAEMLGDRAGGTLELANFVPPDRFFVYVAKPKAILPLLDQGTHFVAASGAGLTGNRLDYGLTRRYFQRLGVTRTWLEAVLESGLVRDLAVMTPDLLLIDGTDITVVARLERPELLRALLRLAGAGGLADDGVVTLDTDDGRPAHWALKGELLCISTHRSELDRVLKLIEADGQGSLGRSTEFRYMLTQIPLRSETRLFAYFSDPFVRRIVGPAVKLGQMRRMQARAEMELLTAQAMLARLDGVAAESVEELLRTKYLPAVFPALTYTIDTDGVVHSKTYGSLNHLKTLQDVPVERVTTLEAEAYKEYVENYARYWRRYFDPIAVRLDDVPGESLELTTFILPLIDNSIYNRLRESLMRKEDQTPLKIPRVEPSPVLQFSVNLRDEFWQNIAGNFAEFFREYGGANPAILDDLGPSVHLAVFDADPVIALGSGDVMGAFGGNVIGGGEMMMIPVALSLLTRPCTILVETRDPKRTARFLRQAANSWLNLSDVNARELEVSFYQVGDQDSWVWTMSIAGIIKLRYGVEVKEGYLVIRNIPWSVKDRVVGTNKPLLNGAGLTVWPGACRLQLPGLFASAADQERFATMCSLGRLYPLIASGVADVDTAGRRHAQLFGFRPLHPATGQWLWQDQHLKSSIYGSAWRQRQPGFDPARPFGLMQSIESMQLNMQFEDAGLRSTIRWKLREAPPSTDRE